MNRELELQDVVKLAKRENNTKRSYLYVNPLQGKHVPASPGISLMLFRQMAQRIESRYAGERVMIVGFAETATAIGSAIACYAGNAVWFMTTTRESIDGASYLYFTESHSHAAEQRLVTNGLAEALQGVDRIVFAEDEVTTGNTIEKLIRAIREKYSDYSGKYGIISVLNSVSPERMEELERSGIGCDYLFRIPEHYRSENTMELAYEPLRSQLYTYSGAAVNTISLGSCTNFRVVTPAETLRTECTNLAQQLIRCAGTLPEGGRVLVLGTEEFMFPGMLFAALLEEQCSGIHVRFHATTRSPIEVSRHPAYPLHERTPLISLYEDGRKTFVYDLQRYDKVFVVTDAADLCRNGLESLLGALEARGNKDINLVRWG